jgi:hypothetical protein
MLNNPQQQAKSIIASFTNDRDRAHALGTLLGEKPPAGLKGEAIIDWVRIKVRQNAYRYLVLAYLCTLVTFTTIIALAAYVYVFRDNANRPPILIQENATRD